MSDQHAALKELGRTHLYPNYGEPPLVLSRGKGCQLWDEGGRRYLDLYAGIAVNTLGHAHPRLVGAIAEQAQRLLHVSNYYYTEPNVRLADALCQTTGFDRAFFCNSGTEAIEAILKLARRYHFAKGDQERHRVIAFDNSFHGRTLGALAVTGQPKYREGCGPMAGATHVPYGDAAAVRRALGGDVAAILAEPIQGEGGVIPAPPGFLAELRKLADESGALLLLDEIQTGIGRTGRFLGAEHDGVSADAVALAKGLGGGMPIGAVLCREFLAKALPPGSHGTTFGGNPLASAAALAVLAVVQEEQLVEKAALLGKYLEAGLARIVAQMPNKALAVRGRGLLQALVLRDADLARDALVALRETGVLVTLAGGNALRFSPPLVVTEVELDEGVGAVARSLERLK